MPKFYYSLSAKISGRLWWIGTRQANESGSEPCQDEITKQDFIGCAETLQNES